MIEIYFKAIRDSEFQKIQDFRVGSWIHVDMASINELQQICDLTQIELTDIKDSLDNYEIPRIEHKDNNTILFVRYPAEEELGLHTSTLAIVITPHYLITISPHESLLVDTIIQSKLNLTTTQRSKLLLYILLKITQAFTYKIKDVRSTVIEQERKVVNINNKAIIKLTKTEEILNQYLSALVPLRNVLEAVATARYVELFEKDQDLLQDLQIGRASCRERV